MPVKLDVDAENVWGRWHAVSTGVLAVVMVIVVACGLGQPGMQTLICSLLIAVFVACGGMLGLLLTRQLGQWQDWDLDLDEALQGQSAPRETTFLVEERRRLDRQVSMYLQRIHSLSEHAIPAADRPAARPGPAQQTIRKPQDPALPQRRQPPRRAAEVSRTAAESS